MTDHSTSSLSVPNRRAAGVDAGQTRDQSEGPDQTHGDQSNEEHAEVSNHDRLNHGSQDESQQANIHRTDSNYSLAGPQTHGHGQDNPPAYVHRTDSYVTPEYQSYQEQYTQEEDRPVWGLAAPLPHTLRPGMRPRRRAGPQTLDSGLPTLSNPQQQKQNLREVRSNLSHRLRPASSGQTPPKRQQSTRSGTGSQGAILEETDQLPTGYETLPRYQTEHGKGRSYSTSAVGHRRAPSRVGYLKAAAINSRHQRDASGQGSQDDAYQKAQDLEENAEYTSKPATDDANEDSTSGQVDQYISRHDSHDFATSDSGTAESAERDEALDQEWPSDEEPARPVLSTIQEVPRPSLIDKPEIEELRKQLQSRPSFVPHQAREVARAPTETDWDHSLPSDKQPQSYRDPSTSTNHPSDDPPKYFNTWASIRHRFREPLSEFLAVYVMMLVGLSANLMYRINLVASPTTTPKYGDFTSTNLCWSWATMAAIYIAGGVSGAHLSPVVTLTLCIFRGFPVKYFLRYAFAQFVACLAAAFTVYGLYRDAIQLTAGEAGLDPYESLIASTSVFHTVPTQGIGSPTAFFTQFVLVALFTVVVLALGDDQNSPPGAGMNAFIVGLFVFVLGCAFPYNTGASFNPFRDLGPRIVVTVVWAESRGVVWTESGWYWVWGCWVAPMCGGVVGGLVYDLFVFTGGESPVNYTDPVGRIRVKVKGRSANVDAGKGVDARGEEVRDGDGGGSGATGASTERRESSSGRFARFRRKVSRKRSQGNSRGHHDLEDGLDVNKGSRDDDYFGPVLTRVSEDETGARVVRARSAL